MRLRQFQSAVLTTNTRYNKLPILVHLCSSNHSKTNPNRPGLTPDSSPLHLLPGTCRQLNNTPTHCRPVMTRALPLATCRHRTIRSNVTTWGVLRLWSRWPQAKTEPLRIGIDLDGHSATLHLDLLLRIHTYDVYPPTATRNESYDHLSTHDLTHHRISIANLFSNVFDCKFLV